jgi:predicted nuclease with TOPRIM domain
VTIEHFKKSL